MSGLRWRLACCLVCVVVGGSIGSAAADESAFPFDQDLILDAAPMRGSKRVPILEIDDNGAASMQLWCVTVQGRAIVGAETITIMPTAAQQGQCAPESRANDEMLVTALAQVTNWRRHGDVIELLGTTTLRFRLMTN